MQGMIYMNMRKGTLISNKFIVLCISTWWYYSFMIKKLIHYHCSVGFFSSEWIWLCSCCLGDEMVSYMHIQWVYSLKMAMDVHHYTLRWLRNEVMERKHREMKILNINQVGGRGFAKEYRNTFEHDKMCLVNEMRAQFFKFVMRIEGTFQKF